MLLVLGILLLLQGLINADAVPLSAIVSRQNDTGPSLPQDCVCTCQDSRSRWDIVWSCLVTIFACSWVSVHPNIPGPGEAWWKRALRRLELMFWSIIAPELIIFWALSQWTGARSLAKKYHNMKWTKTHGYFIQMGGFMLYNGDMPKGVLDPEKLEGLLTKKEILIPTITEEEIKDRSKGDGLSKALVIIQTTWFIAHYIARRVRGLVITEIELITLAFAALNVVMYYFWWNKPLDLATTVPVYLLHPSPTKSCPSANPLSEGEPMDLDGNNPRDNPTLRTRDSEGNKIEVASQIPPPSDIPTHQAIKVLNIRDLARQAWRLVSGISFRWPAAAAVAVFMRIGDIWDSNTISEGRMGVNTFYSYNPDPTRSNWEEYGVGYALPVIGMLFGAIHCAGWNFMFPSLAEATIWRVSSAVITGVPAIGLVVFFLVELDDYYEHKNPLAKLSLVSVTHLLYGTIPFYVLARLGLLVEALISLRDLPHGALAVVEWTSFLPHV